MIFEELKKNLNIEILLGAKTHMGHRTFHTGMKKNLLMKSGSYYKHDGYYVIDVRKTLVQLKKALNLLFEVASKNERILFVGTDPSISHLVSEYAENSAQYYVAKKWQGGMLTNFKVVKESLFEIKSIEKLLEKGACKHKEEVRLRKKLEKKQKCLSGIKDMGGLPHVVVVIDAIACRKAINEANRLGILVIGIVDTNADPTGVDCVIPSNDDVSVKFFLEIFSGVIIEGMKQAFKKSELSANDSSRNTKNLDVKKRFTDKNESQGKKTGLIEGETFKDDPSDSSDSVKVKILDSDG